MTGKAAGVCSRNLSGAARNALADATTRWRYREHLRQRLRHAHAGPRSSWQWPVSPFAVHRPQRHSSSVSSQTPPLPKIHQTHANARHLRTGEEAARRSLKYSGANGVPQLLSWASSAVGAGESSRDDSTVRTRSAPRIHLRGCAGGTSEAYPGPVRGVHGACSGNVAARLTP